MGLGTLQRSKGIMHGWEAPVSCICSILLAFVSEILPNVEMVVSAQAAPCYWSSDVSGLERLDPF